MKFVKFSMVCVMGLALAGVAAAADAGQQVEEQKIVKELKINAEYRAGVTYNDNKADGDDAEATMLFDLEHARLGLSAELENNINAVFSFDLIDNSVGEDEDKEPIVSSVKDAYVGYKAGMFTLNVGQKKVKQGGFMQAAASYNAIGSDVASLELLPFESYAPMVEFKFALAGELTVQLVNELTANEDFVVENEEQKRPTVVVDWLGDFGSEWKPLVQLGTYADFKGMFYTVGVEGSVAGLFMQLDAFFDKYETAAKQDVEYTAYNAYFEYDLGVIAPFVEGHMFEVKDGKEVTEIGLGATYTQFGDHYTPYVSVLHDDDDSKDTNLRVKLGVFGKF